jgi:hypothetical protein
MIKLCLFALAQELYLSVMPLRLLSREQLKCIARGSDYECARTVSSRAARALAMLTDSPLARMSWGQLMDSRERVLAAAKYARGSDDRVLRSAVQTAYSLTASEIARRTFS